MNSSSDGGGNGSSLERQLSKFGNNLGIKNSLKNSSMARRSNNYSVISDTHANKNNIFRATHGVNDLDRSPFFNSIKVTNQLAKQDGEVVVDQHQSTFKPSLDLNPV